MFGLKGLQQRLAGGFHPPRPASDLPHQLERPLCCPQVSPLQTQIGVDHPHQRQQREIVPLGHQLRADDDVGPARRNRLDMGFQRPGRPVQV